jgi:hypothetical protein
MTKTRAKKPDAKPVKAEVIRKVSFKYIFSPDYNPVYANGAYGGPTSQGEIAVNFFVERQPVPIEDTWSISPDGKLLEQVAREPKGEEGTALIIRFVTGGVIMNLEVAKRVYAFLGRHIAQLEGAMAVNAVAEASKKTNTTHVKKIKK